MTRTPSCPLPGQGESLSWSWTGGCSRPAKYSAEGANGPRPVGVGARSRTLAFGREFCLRRWIGVLAAASRDRFIRSASSFVVWSGCLGGRVVRILVPRDGLSSISRYSTLKGLDFVQCSSSRVDVVRIARVSGRVCFVLSPGFCRKKNLFAMSRWGPRQLGSFARVFSEFQYIADERNRNKHEKRSSSSNRSSNNSQSSLTRFPYTIATGHPRPIFNNTSIDILLRTKQPWPPLPSLISSILISIFGISGITRRMARRPPASIPSPASSARPCSPPVPRSIRWRCARPCRYQEALSI